MDEIIRKKKPVRKWVDIPIDPEVTGELAVKENQLSDAENRLNRERMKAKTSTGKSLAEGSSIQEIEKEIERLEAELEALWEQSQDSIQRFWFEDIGKKAYDDLVSAHRPTAEQKQEWKDEGGEGVLAYNINTFPPALLAAAAISPTMTTEQADKIFEEWGNWEVIRLFNTAQAACAGISTVPKSRRSLTDTDSTPTSD